MEFTMGKRRCENLGGVCGELVGSVDRKLDAEKTQV